MSTSKMSTSKIFLKTDNFFEISLTAPIGVRC
jgi:hypothetical protein